MSTLGELYEGHQMRTFRVRTDAGPAALSSLVAIAAEAGALVGDLRVVEAGPGPNIVRDVTLYFGSGAQLEVLVGRLSAAARGFDALPTCRSLARLPRLRPA